MFPELYNAAASGKVQSLFQILERREINPLVHLTSTKNNVLHIAVMFNQKSIVSRLLSKFPGLLSLQNSNGDTPFHLAAEISSLEIRAPEADIDMVEHLITRAKEISHIKNNQDLKEILGMKNFVKKDTALHVAVRNGNINGAKLLMKEHPGSVGMENGTNEFPLYLAVEGGFCDIAKHILDNFSPLPNKCGGSNGMNALHAAVIRSHRVPLDYPKPAADLSLSEIRRKIRDFGLGVKEKLREFLHRENNKKRQALLEFMDELLGKPTCADLVKGKDTSCKWTPLHLAAHLGNLEATRRILKHHASIADDLDLMDKEGMSALHIAAKEGHDNVMEEIISRRPDACDLVDEKGRTALHIAVASEKLKVVKYILSKPELKFLKNTADNEGNTPLHLAVILKNHHIMKALANDKGVDKRAVNLKSLKPIDVVRNNSNIGELIKSLLVKTMEEQGDQGSLQAIVNRVDYNNQNSKDIEAQYEENVAVARRDHHVKDMKSIRLKNICSAHQMVAILIATLAFTAAFTIPESVKDGQDKAGLRRKFFFQVFVIADLVAFYCATASVFLQFFSSVEYNYHLLLRFTRLSSFLTYISGLAITLAFTMGMHIAMPDASMLSDSIFVMGCCFLALYIIGFL